MRWAMTIVIAVAAGSPVASAGIGNVTAESVAVVAPDREPFNPGPSGPGGGYDPRDGAFDGVRPGDGATMSLKMHDINGNTVSINGGGDVSVVRGPTYTDIGANRNGSSRVQASWESVISGDRMYLVALFRLTSITDQIMPIGSNNNGVPAFAWSWNFSTVDHVEFQPWVTSVRIRQALGAFSNDLGASYTNGSIDFTAQFPPGEWNPAQDFGLPFPTIGDGTNAILLSYELDIIPAPATLGLFAGLLAIGRRRR
ncbi:hypothetical protein PHYC_02479 [Phycisphaerales bacterium]|nr:hypothetical protein PHYC_02479 [Phycisphaerales bacterium]